MKKLWLTVTLFILSLCGFPENFQAMENDFSASIMTTSHQIGESKGHFNLLLKPNEEDLLPVKIINTSSKTQVFTVSINDAATNINGIVDYTMNAPTSYDNSRLKVTELVKKKYLEVSVEKNSGETVYISVKMPNQMFDGTLLGGVTVRKKEDGKQNKEMLENIFAYSFAIQICQNQKVICPKLMFKDINIEQLDNRNAVSMVLNNVSPTLISHLVGTFTIISQKDGRLITEEKREDMSIAPNNQFSLPVFLNKEFIPGKYTYKLTLKSEKNQWEFEKNFEISSKEARQFNQISVDGKEGKKSMMLIIFFLIIIIILTSIIVKELLLIDKNRY